MRDGHPRARPRPRSPTACCDAARRAAGRAERSRCAGCARAAAGRAGRAGVSPPRSCVGDRGDGRLRAARPASTAPPRSADLPDVIARFVPRAARRASTRGCARCRTSQARSYRFEVADVAPARRGRPRHRTRRDPDVDARRAPRLRGRRRATTCAAAAARSSSSAGWRASGACTSGDRLDIGRARAAARRRRSRSRPTTSPTRWPRPRASTSHARDRAPLRLVRPTPANLALLWLHDRDAGRRHARPRRGRVRSAIGGLQFITRDGVRVLLDQAAGIVIALLVAFSLVALVAAGTMLAARRARRRPAPAAGVRRAARARLHAGRGSPRCRRAEAALVALPGGALGLGRGRARGRRPGAPGCSRRSTSRRPARRCSAPLALRRSCVVAVVVAAADVAGLARGAPSAGAILRGGELRDARGPGPRGPRRAASALGARFADRRRAGAGWPRRPTIAVCARRGHADARARLAARAAARRPRRRSASATSSRSRCSTRRALPRCARSRASRRPALRYEVDAADSFRLGEPLRLVAYPGDHTRFEAPPLAAGPAGARAAARSRSALGLADALGLRAGLDARRPAPERRRGALPGQRRRPRARARRADRVGARGPAARAADPGLSPQIAVRLGRAPTGPRSAARLARPRRRRRRRVGGGDHAQRAVPRRARRASLRGVGLAVGLVCLYALVQALAMTARERRGAVALLRACGGDAATVAAGARRRRRWPSRSRPRSRARARARRCSGRSSRRLAAGFADARRWPPTAGQVALVVGGLLALAAVADRAGRRGACCAEPVVAGLREE